ncbi:MAG: hypothetical protein CBC57_00390 [Euryarchaeota archaeon TMED97]|nr:MAG: hypothetical protein CBC57_00390 [Euryarchaeota archaeon TMED97]
MLRDKLFTRNCNTPLEYDLVKRTVNDRGPSTVEYELTNLGVSLLPSLDSFFDWVSSQ